MGWHGLRGTFGVLVYGAALAATAAAQDQIRFELAGEAHQGSPGTEFELRLTAEIDPGWHLYSMTQPSGGPVPTQITLPDDRPFELSGDIVQPPFKIVYDPNFEIDTELIEGTADFYLPLRVKADAEPGEGTLQVAIRYMMCDDKRCLPPQTRRLEHAFTVTAPARKSAGGTAAGATVPAKPEGQTAEAAPAAEDSEAVAAPVRAAAGLPASLWSYILLAASMGGLALLTPCVFPMIPITVSYFTKREAVTRPQALKEAAGYGVGIILTFTLLGFGLTFLLGAGGINRVAASPWVNLLIATVFVVFAMSLFGALEIRLPSGWIEAVDRRSGTSGGIVGVLLMALTFSLTSFTCTVPFLGTVMVAALQGDWLWSLVGVAVYSAVFAAPFFILALFPALLASLPKSGNWMNSLKITMGFIELAAAMKFLSNIDLVYQWEFLTRPVFIAVWLAIALVTAIYLLGWFRFPHETPTESIGPLRVLSAIFFLSVSFFLLRGLFGFSLGELNSFLPPRDYGAPAGQVSVGFAADEAPAEWLSDYQQALVVAKRTGKPIFIDFTGYTCTNCRWMEENIFVLPRVRARFRDFVLVRLYTDGNKTEHEDNMRFEQERFNTIALPLYAIMSAEDEILSVFAEGMTRDENRFLEFLDEGRAGVSLARAGLKVRRETLESPLR